MARQLRALGTFLLVIASGLAAAQGIPSLRDYDDETRQSIEIACISAKTKGPAAYGACLNQQIASLQSSPGIANLSRHDSETRHTTLPTPRSGGTNSDKSRSGGTAAHSVNPMSQFATKSIITQREDQKYEKRGDRNDRSDVSTDIRFSAVLLSCQPSSRRAARGTTRALYSYSISFSGGRLSGG